MYKKRKSIDQEFVKWLQSKKNLKERSSRDVRSHLLRADEIIDIDDMTLHEPEVTYGFSKSERYQKLSSSTKSHLKRAVRLYKEYLGEKLHD
ncbi:hypothetical protein [Lunatimonas salinarum]|uniref:hypothetical protein n=1 Tax=Lunatimonas salinarum TaxID=1774590 RepID=UPI001AE0BB0A|nr:hypothetical protein [Lunatimonas salinarum]